MSDKNEKFKIAYAVSLVGQLGFYIAIPLLVAILGGNYLDKVIFGKYLLQEHHTAHYIFLIIFPLLAGIFSIWQIYKLILPLMDDNGKRKK